MDEEQTAIEWLYFIMESLIPKKDRIHLQGVLEKALQMQQEQLTNKK
jgi:hypothetical protein